MTDEDERDEGDGRYTHLLANVVALKIAVGLLFVRTALEERDPQTWAFETVERMCGRLGIHRDSLARSEFNRQLLHLVEDTLRELEEDVRAQLTPGR